MKNLNFIKIILPLIGVVMISCSKTKPCDACDEAIEHMFAKIEQNNCNPAFMEDAADRIKDECDNYDYELYMGVMALSCCEGNTILPKCGANTGMDIDVVFYHKESIDQPLWVEVGGTSLGRFQTDSVAGIYPPIIRTMFQAGYKSHQLYFYAEESDLQPVKFDSKSYNLRIPNSTFIECKLKKVFISKDTNSHYIIEYENW